MWNLHIGTYKHNLFWFVLSGYSPIFFGRLELLETRFWLSKLKLWMALFQIAWGKYFVGPPKRLLTYLGLCCTPMCGYKESVWKTLLVKLISVWGLNLSPCRCVCLSVCLHVLLLPYTPWGKMQDYTTCLAHSCFLLSSRIRTRCSASIGPIVILMADQDNAVFYPRPYQKPVWPWTGHFSHARPIGNDLTTPS